MMMMRVGAILSRNLRRRQIGGLFYCTCSFDATNSISNSNPSNFISQVEQPTFVKHPLDTLDQLPSSDNESLSSDEESSSSDEEFSASDEESSSSDGESSYSYGKKYSRFHVKWSLEEILKRPLTDVDHYKGLVAPLAQVFSVSLHTDSDDDKPCDIYGTICTTNAQGLTLNNLYKRPHANSEVIPNGGILSLKGGLNNFLTYSPTTNTTIDLDLNVKSRNTVLVIKEKRNLHSFNQDDFEDSSNKLIKDIVHGEGCFAVIYYAKFLYAVRAVVRVAIFSKRDPSSAVADVYGNIALGYGNARKYCNNDDEVRHMKCTLFSKTFDHPKRVRVGETMKLSNYVVAMPAYSSLVIDADISDSHGRLAAGSLEIPFDGPHQKVIDGEFGTIAVTVLFSTPRRSEYIAEVGEFAEQAEDPHLEIDDRKKNLEVVDDERFDGAVLTELLSVYVGGTNHEVPAVCGSIRIFDSFHPDWTIFERRLDNPVYFSVDKGFIPIEKHSVIDTDYYCSIKFCFADPLNGKELCISDGTICFEYVLLMHNPPCVPLDKRLCSYIQGAHGYALLHYIIFESACQAKVEITLFSNQQNHLLSSLPVRLCGFVVASYNNHTYTTAYEKKYCRSRLFYKPQPEFVEVDSDMIVPLSKSVIAVPEGVGLVVEVNMEVLSPGNKKDIVFGKKVFNVNMSRPMHEEILGNCYGVQISTKFTCA
ncbi:uncharacterized protein LOC141616555 [Silene latifolia]|uniref:uncharacterized protein LOC141616555 n=1 Tax=Silene latifolia TaxID=37657 RepID=UPI003D77B7BD